MTRSKTAERPKRIASALVLTGIFYLGATLSLLSVAGTTPQQVQSKGELVNRRDRLPRAIANAVRRDVSEKTGIPRGRLRVTESSQQQWPDTCLGLPQAAEVCGEVLIQGWRVVVSDGSRSWVYHTDTSGQSLRLEASTVSTNLPNSIATAVLQEASQMSGLPVTSLRVVDAQRSNVSYRPEFCMGGAPPPPGMCDLRQIPGWQVTVENPYQQRWIFAIDDTAAIVNSEDGQYSTNFLPLPISSAVREALSAKTGISQSQLNILQARRGQWPDSCLGLARTDESCRNEVVEGWRIVLYSGEKSWVFRAGIDPDRLNIRLEDFEAATKSLPGAIANAVLQNVSSRSNYPVTALRIVQAQQQTWPNSCLGFTNGTCTQAEVPGWRITVAAGEDRYWIYRTGESASQIVLDERATELLASWQLPLPLP